MAITRNAREVRFWLNQRFSPRAKKYFFSVFFAKIRRKKYTCGIARPLRGERRVFYEVGVRGLSAGTVKNTDSPAD